MKIDQMFFSKLLSIYLHFRVGGKDGIDTFRTAHVKTFEKFCDLFCKRKKENNYSF